MARQCLSAFSLFYCKTDGGFAFEISKKNACNNPLQNPRWRLFSSADEQKVFAQNKYDTDLAILPQ